MFCFPKGGKKRKRTKSTKSKWDGSFCRFRISSSSKRKKSSSSSVPTSPLPKRKNTKNSISKFRALTFLLLDPNRASHPLSEHCEGLISSSTGGGRKFGWRVTNLKLSLMSPNSSITNDFPLQKIILGSKGMFVSRISVCSKF